MERYAAWGLVTLGILAAGCRPRFFQVSIHPFFEPAVVEAELTGRWASDDDELVFARAGENEWQLRIAERDGGGDTRGEDAAEAAVVRLGRVGGMLFWDMSAEEPPSSGELAKEHLLRLHSVARLRLEGDTMEIACLDARFMSEAVAEGRVQLSHVLEGDVDGDQSVILTAPTADLVSFLEAYGESTEAFGEPGIYHRVR
jgi:hypothetical protein